MNDNDNDNEKDNDNGVFYMLNSHTNVILYDVDTEN